MHFKPFKISQHFRYLTHIQNFHFSVLVQNLFTFVALHPIYPYRCHFHLLNQSVGHQLVIVINCYISASISLLILIHLLLEVEDDETVDVEGTLEKLFSTLIFKMPGKKLK